MGNSHYSHNRASRKKKVATTLPVIIGHPEKKEEAITLPVIIGHPANGGGAKGQRRRIFVSIRITGRAPTSYLWPILARPV